MTLQIMHFLEPQDVLCDVETLCIVPCSRILQNLESYHIGRAPRQGIRLAWVQELLLMGLAFTPQ